MKNGDNQEKIGQNGASGNSCKIINDGKNISIALIDETLDKRYISIQISEVADKLSKDRFEQGGKPKSIFLANKEVFVQNIKIQGKSLSENYDEALSIEDGHERGEKLMLLDRLAAQRILLENGYMVDFGSNKQGAKDSLRSIESDYPLWNLIVVKKFMKYSLDIVKKGYLRIEVPLNEIDIIDIYNKFKAKNKASKIVGIEQIRRHLLDNEILGTVRILEWKKGENEFEAIVNGERRKVSFTKSATGSGYFLSCFC